MIKVHHLNNSRSQRVLWLLEELNEPYEVVRYQRDKLTMRAPDQLKRVHPLGKSPVIEAIHQLDPSPPHRCLSAARPSDRSGLIAQLQSHSAAILGTSECSAVTSSRFLDSLLILSRKLWNRT